MTAFREPRAEASAADPVTRIARLLVGFDTFAYHRHLGETLRLEHPLEVWWSKDDVIDRAVTHGAEAVSIQTCYLPIHTSALEGRGVVEDLVSVGQS